MQIEVKDIKGKAVKKVDLPDNIFGLDLNDHVLHSVVKAYQANRRQGTVATKTRALVRGGGKKPFRQKGTGNARQGSSRTNLHPGGAVAHGPQQRDHRQGTNKKLRKLAMRVALSDKARHGKIVVVDDFAISSFSTKHVCGIAKSLSLTSALFSDERKDDFLFKSARNIHKMGCVRPSDMNAEDVLRHETLVLSETALDSIKQRFA